MTFKELIELYKSGKASDMQKKMVEDEVEKFEAVSDYVYSEENVEPLMSATNSEAARTDMGDSKAFSKSVKRKIRFTVISICILVFIAFILIQMALPPIIDNFYYDPTKEGVISEEENDSGGTGTVLVSQIDLDFPIFAQLRMPLEYRKEMYAESLGYGKYDLMISQSYFSENEIAKPTVGGNITRNELNLYPPDFIYNNAFEGRFPYSDMEDENNDKYSSESNSEFNEEFLKSIDKYDDDKMLKVIASFPESISYTDMRQIEKKYDLDSPWYAVANEDEEKTIINLGFSCVNNKVYEDYDNPDYPYLFKEQGKEQWNDEEYMKQFLLSMIKYMDDQPGFRKVFEYSNEHNDKIYRDAYDFIKKNGINIYGTVTYVSKAYAEKLVGDGVVMTIALKDPGQQ